METLNELVAFLADYSISIDIPAIIAMLALGYIIKHMPVCRQVSNNLIPWIIVIGCFVLELLKLPSVDTKSISNMIISSIVSAAIAVGIHQYGKNFFLNSRKILDFLNNKSDDTK